MVQAGQADLGVVPFENSTHGTVTFTLDGLADRDGTHGALSVCGEIFLPVHHFLLGRKGPNTARGHDESLSPGTCTPTAARPSPARPRAKPLTSLSHVQRIFSHPQGFGQTTAFLATYLKGVDTVDVTSTSRAAEMAALDESGTSAAISSEMAAAQHGLDILARCIEDKEDNTTRFFVLRRGSTISAEPPWRSRSPGDHEAKASGGERGEAAVAAVAETKSLVSFTVSHQSPGALADVLECFRRHGLNLTSINSLPSLAQPFQYLFFVEFEGSKLEDPDGRVKDALEGIAEVAQTWRWLGSWHKQRPRPSLN